MSLLANITRDGVMLSNETTSQNSTLVPEMISDASDQDLNKTNLLSSANTIRSASVYSIMNTSPLSVVKSEFATMGSGQDFNKTQQYYLDQLNGEFTDLVLPAIIYLGILMVIGIVGNSLVLYVYTYKTRAGTITRYIQALAVFDLMSCCLAIPGEIVDMTQNFTFGRSPLCKATRTVNLFGTMASGVTLVIVAVDRYKRICSPLKAQISTRGANIIVIICTCICLVLSLPSAAIFGSRTVPTRWDFVNGTDCSISDQFIETALPLAYNSFQMLLFLVGAVILTVIYFFIARTIFRQAHLRKVRETRRRSVMIPGDGQVIPFADRSTHSSVDPSSPETNGGDHCPVFISHEGSSGKKLNYGSKTKRDKIICPKNKLSGTCGDSKLADSKKLDSLLTATPQFVEVELNSNTPVSSPPETPIDQQYFDYRPLIKSNSNTTQHHGLRHNGQNQSRRCPMEQLDEMEPGSSTSSCEIEHNEQKREPPQIQISSSDNTPEKPTNSENLSNQTSATAEKPITENSKEINSEIKIATNEDRTLIRVKQPQTPGDGDSGFGDGGSEEKLRWSLTLMNSASKKQRKVLIRSYSDVGRGAKKTDDSHKRAVTSDDENTNLKDLRDKTTKNTLQVPRRQRRHSSFRKFRPDIRRLTITDPQGTRRTTLMLFLITLIYILSFLPHLLLMIIKATQPTSLSGEGGSMELAHNILIRSYFINSVANPIIYSFCSRDFFSHCLRSRRAMNKQSF